MRRNLFAEAIVDTIGLALGTFSIHELIRFISG